MRLLVLSTAASRDEAESIARYLVEGGLAACVNILPVTSVYRWKGGLERSGEHLLLMKTRAEAFEGLKAAIVSRHSYEVPEVIACPITKGHAPYLAWLDGSVTTRPRPTPRSGRRGGPRHPRTRR